ncbi:DUF427 domain-containing protein [Lapillicoccus sp.]|uniref:DUF427 domain-containing protein n=1 Tax=Lapillicoccus sp. TaxID=1909287 RepID=UPI003264ABE6
MAVQMRSVLFSVLPQTRVQPVDLRLRADAGGDTVVDTVAAWLVWEPRRVVCSFAVPVTDIVGRLVPSADGGTTGTDLSGLPPVLTPRDPFAVHSTPGTVHDIETADGTLAAAAFVPEDPDLDGYAILDWDAFSRWREEEEILVGHPRQPLHRVQCLTSSRHIVVEIGGEVVADSRAPVLLLETDLPPRWYLPRADVRMDLLTRSPSHTTCAYKGKASYYSTTAGGQPLDDIAWTYADPEHDGVPVRDLLCFYVEHTNTIVDGERVGRPVTDWSRQRT